MPKNGCGSASTCGTGADVDPPKRRRQCGDAQTERGFTSQQCDAQTKWKFTRQQCGAQTKRRCIRQGLAIRLKAGECNVHILCSQNAIATACFHMGMSSTPPRDALITSPQLAPSLQRSQQRCTHLHDGGQGMCRLRGFLGVPFGFISLRFCVFRVLLGVGSQSPLIRLRFLLRIFFWIRFSSFWSLPCCSTAIDAVRGTALTVGLVSATTFSTFHSFQQACIDLFGSASSMFPCCFA